jgi:hypothetical protein
VNRYLPARLPPHVAESAASASPRHLSHPSPTSSFRDNLAPPDQGPTPLNLDSLHLPTGLCRSPPPSSTSSPLTRAQVVTPRRLQLLLPPPATPSRRRRIASHPRSSLLFCQSRSPPAGRCSTMGEQVDLRRTCHLPFPFLSLSRPCATSSLHTSRRTGAGAGRRPHPLPFSLCGQA